MWLLGSARASSASSQLSLSSFNFSTQLPFVSSLHLHQEHVLILLKVTNN